MVHLKTFWGKIVEVKVKNPGLFWFITILGMTATLAQIILCLSAELKSQIIFTFILIGCWALFICLPQIALNFTLIRHDYRDDTFEK